MTARADRAARLTALAFAALWLYGVAAALGWPDAAHWPLRLALAALAAWFLAMILRRGATALLLSPLTALGLLALVFYSLLPSLYVGAGAASDALKPVVLARAEDFLRGRGELLVLQFSAISLAVSVLLGPAAPVPRAMQETSPRAARLAACGAAAIIGLAASVLVLRRAAPAIVDALAPELARQVFDGMAPVIAFAAVALAFLAARQPWRWAAAALVAVVIAAAALMTTLAAKQAVFILVACLLAFVVARRVRARQMATAVAVAAALLVSGILILGVLRGGLAPPGIAPLSARGLPYIGSAILYKAVARQTETDACLQRAVETALPGGEGASPAYFLAVLVPRALWPDKPNFSEGMQFGFRFCGLRPGDVAPGAPQSFSISLLGQPVVRAGWAGLAVAELSLVAALGLFTLLCLRRRPVGLILLAALLPWLADFDQSFALYVGNAAKMFLYQLPLLAALVWARRRWPADAAMP